MVWSGFGDELFLVDAFVRAFLELPNFFQQGITLGTAEWFGREASGQQGGKQREQA